MCPAKKQSVTAECGSAGEVLFGTDSHTCNAGAFGQFATGIGNTDAGFIVGTGKLLIKVPPTMRFKLEGEMPPYLLAKDLILQIIGEISVAGELMILPGTLPRIPPLSSTLPPPNSSCPQWGDESLAARAQACSQPSVTHLSLLKSCLSL